MSFKLASPGTYPDSQPAGTRRTAPRSRTWLQSVYAGLTRMLQRMLANLFPCCSGRAPTAARETKHLALCGGRLAVLHGRVPTAARSQRARASAESGDEEGGEAHAAVCVGGHSAPTRPAVQTNLGDVCRERTGKRKSERICPFDVRSYPFVSVHVRSI
jgi:hypothetical protein